MQLCLWKQVLDLLRMPLNMKKNLNFLNLCRDFPFSSLAGLGGIIAKKNAVPCYLLLSLCASEVKIA